MQAGARRADRDRGHGGRPLDLDTAQRLVDELAVEHPVLVRETVPRRISLAGLADQLTLLAEDDIGEDQLFAVLEAVAREPEDLPAEELNQRIRRRLAPTITANLVGDADTLDVAVLDDGLEHVLVDGISTTATGTRLALPLELTERVASQCAAAIAGLPKPVLVVHPRVRRALRQLLAAAAVSAAVLGHGELESHVRVRVAARVEA